MHGARSIRWSLKSDAGSSKREMNIAHREHASFAPSQGWIGA